MAYFHCLIGGGSSGGGYELTVTCDADFAGTTITATDGVTTLTQTCPSASPYEVVFEIPNGGDWTISGVVSGQTITTGVNIPTTATLEAIVQKTITIYSAKEDTITYTDIYGDTQTEVFASGQSSKQITVDVIASGSSITFTSGVAKDPSNLSNYYSKTVTIDSNTTEIYIMPNNALYWYGYMSSNFEETSPSNGWTNVTNYYSPTFNTNYLTMNASANNMAFGVGNKTAITGMSKAYAIGSGSGSNAQFTCQNEKSFTISITNYATFSSLNKYELTNNSDYGYITANAQYRGNSITLYAMWYE